MPFCTHPGVELRANLRSIPHRCHLFEVAFVWEFTRETIHLPLGCLQGGELSVLDRVRVGYRESKRCSKDTYPESNITKYTS